MYRYEYSINVNVNDEKNMRSSNAALNRSVFVVAARAVVWCSGTPSDRYRESGHDLRSDHPRNLGTRSTDFPDHAQLLHQHRPPAWVAPTRAIEKRDLQPGHDGIGVDPVGFRSLRLMTSSLVQHFQATACLSETLTCAVPLLVYRATLTVCLLIDRFSCAP